ncbi:MAG: ABC transporter ATP-binding protein [Candidatus Methanofastidiosia archaeon]|jgi:putative ABC transport system ATP-binding protein
MSSTIIEVIKVRKEFGKKHAKVVAVKDVSLKVEKGEVVLILGPSGSGKTTLLSLIGCIMTPTTGEVFIHGINVMELPEKMLPGIRKKYIGFVFQGFNLLKALTVLENVEVALNLNDVKGTEAKKRAQEILVEVGLEERIDFYPADLSGGEKQRVSIARALVTNPDVILADEPTGNLDSKTGQKISLILKTLAKEKGASVIIVTHDNRIEHIADRILYVEDGVIKEKR